MKKKPDNVVFNYNTKEYDSFKKKYPTSFSSKNFTIEKIENLKHESQPYFKKKYSEIKEQFEELVEELKWNELIFNSDYNFNPIIGKKYYLYKKNNKTFLSLIKPEEWDIQCIGGFKLKSNKVWEKINIKPR
tara:strand:- start:495 stop:890 length:396 start_codon:yes stop_codon:yes gene_type:complete